MKGGRGQWNKMVTTLFSPVVWGKMKIVSVMASDGEKQTKFLAKALIHFVFQMLVFAALWWPTLGMTLQYRSAE